MLHACDTCEGLAAGIVARYLDMSPLAARLRLMYLPRSRSVCIDSSIMRCSVTPPKIESTGCPASRSSEQITIMARCWSTASGDGTIPIGLSRTPVSRHETSEAFLQMRWWPTCGGLQRLVK